VVPPKFKPEQLASQQL